MACSAGRCPRIEQIAQGIAHHVERKHDGEDRTARADTVPPIDVASVDSPSPLNPLGVKGTGEGSAVPGPAAIANAVEDVLGGKVDLTQILLRPEGVLAALRL